MMCGIFLGHLCQTQVPGGAGTPWSQSPGCAGTRCITNATDLSSYDIPREGRVENRAGLSCFGVGW